MESNVPIKEMIIKKLIANNQNVIKDTIVNEATMLLVINHQFESIVKATAVHNEVEISGFGKLLFSMKRATSKLSRMNDILNAYMRKLENPDISDNERQALQMKITSATGMIKSLKTKLNYNENESTTDI